MFTPAQRLAIIRTCQSKMQRDAAVWNRHRRWYQSRYWQKDRDRPQGSMLADETSPETLLETNYPYAFIDTMIANVCPLNPQVTVHARREEAAGVAKVRETLANEALRREQAHEKLWSISAAASLYPRGFIKIVWDTKRLAPKFRLVDPRRVFFDMSAGCWEEIRYLVEVVTMTEQEFRARTKRARPGGKVYTGDAVEKARFDAYPKWLLDTASNQSMMAGGADDVFRWVTVFEFYDFTSGGSFCHLIEESPEPLLEEDFLYESVRNPFKMLTFNDNMEDLGGMSDVQLIEGLQEQLNELDTLELAFYKANIPVAMIDSGKLADPEGFKSAWANSSQPGSFIDVKRRATEPGSIADVIQFTQTPNVLLGFQAKREQLVRQIEFLLGIPQYSRGVVGVADVATEVALSDAATRTRNGRRQKKVYDVVKWMGESAVALYHEYMKDDHVVRAQTGPTTPPVSITRASAGMPPEGKPGEPVEPPTDWEFEAVPYSGVENNRMIQLRNIRDAWPMLMQGVEMKLVDPAMLYEKLADALMVPDVLGAGAGAQTHIPGAPPLGGSPPRPPDGLGEDTRATGALPPGTEPAMPPMPFGGPGNGGGSPVARGTSAYPE